MAAQSNMPIGLLDGVNTGVSVAAGDRVLVQGQILNFANKSLYEVPIEVYLQLLDTAAGAAGTVQFQSSVNGSTWVSWGSVQTFTALAGVSASLLSVGKLAVPYFRANVLTLTGTAPVFRAYLLRGM